MAHDSAATRARLLDAAFDEFVAVGLAGARVDRIARHARANKQAIYAYFGSKDALFDAVLDQRYETLMDQVAYTPNDLGDYTGRLFDHLVANPGIVRLAQWRALERDAPAPAEIEAFAAKSKALADSLGLDEHAAADILVIVTTTVQAWALTPLALLMPTAVYEPRRLIGHRDLVVRVARVLTEGLDSPSQTPDEGAQPQIYRKP